MTTTNQIDLAGLLNAGLIDLGDVFEGAAWSTVEVVAGENVVQTATRYGIVAYRWAVVEGRKVHDHGATCLDIAEAREEAAAEAVA